MNEEDLKRQLAELARARGAKHVCAALLGEGLSPRQSDLLSTGDHKGGFRRKTVAAVCAVLTKEGKSARAS